MGGHLGVAAKTIDARADFVRSPLDIESERAALEFAETVTMTGRDASDERFARRRRFADANALIELPAVIAGDNASRQFNRAWRVLAPSLGTR